MQIGSQPKRKKKKLKKIEKRSIDRPHAHALTHTHITIDTHTIQHTLACRCAHPHTLPLTLTSAHARERGRRFKKVLLRKIRKMPTKSDFNFHDPRTFHQTLTFLSKLKKSRWRIFFPQNRSQFWARMFLPEKPPGVEHQPSLYQYDFNSNIR